MPQAATVSENNKRIAKNTLMLYVKMAFTISLGIFATRVLLQALGADDYGLVTVIGGVVTMFAFLSSTMWQACSRFFSFELGQKNKDSLKQTFNLTQLIYLGLAVILFVLLETVGLWFLENKVVIPPERADAAFWFFQFSVGTFLLGILSIPYVALISSHENVKAFASIAIFEAAGRLGIIYLISLSSFDRLAFYGALLSVVGIFHFLINYLVCRLKYPESRFAFFWDKRRFIELLSFGGWNLWGAMSGLFTNVFINVLLNNYFGPAVNAARGIAVQLSAAITAFTTNFMTAVNPQIIKYYASGDIHQSHLLAMRASRVGFFLLFFFALPAWLLMPFVLGLWLEEVPAHTVWFTRLILVQLLVDVLSYPLTTLAQASGRIALFQSVIGVVLWSTLPLAWMLLKFFFVPPESVACVAIAVSCICFGLRLVLVRRCAQLSIRIFLRKTLFPVCLAASVSMAVPVWLTFSIISSPSWSQVLVVGSSSVLSTIIAVMFLGVSFEERLFLIRFIRTKI